MSDIENTSVPKNEQFLWLEKTKYTAEELGNILKEMYENSDENFKSASIHMFGMTYKNLLIKKIPTKGIFHTLGWDFLFSNFKN